MGINSKEREFNMSSEKCNALTSANAYILRAIEVQAKVCWADYLILKYYRGILFKIERSLKIYIDQNEQLIDDLCHAAFNKFHTKIIGTTSRPKKRDNDAEKAWVLRVAESLTIDQLRKNEPQTRFDPTSHGSSSISFEQTDLNDWIESLPEPDRQIVKMKSQGYIPKEILEATGLSEREVKKKIERAKMTLHKFLGK